MKYVLEVLDRGALVTVFVNTGGSVGKSWTIKTEAAFATVAEAIKFIQEERAHRQPVK